jgi:hypothetical protein
MTNMLRHSMGSTMTSLHVHYRKQGFIRRSKPMNVPSKLMNIVYIQWLTNQSTDECNSNEIKSSYSSVPMNVMTFLSVTWNRRIYTITFIGDTSSTNILGTCCEPYILVF